MPSRSMSPSTVEDTSVRVTPRAAATLAMPAVRQAASACSRYSTGVGPLSDPTSTGGWSASKVNGCRWVISCFAPWKPWIVDWLWVPLSQRFVARNWNLARSASARTASRVANRVAVSTPLRVALSMLVMGLSPRCGSAGGGESLADDVGRAFRPEHPYPARICDTRAGHGWPEGDTEG